MVANSNTATSTAADTEAAAGAGTVLVEHSGALAWVTLAHPGKLNAMSCAMWVQLRAVFEGLQRHPGVRCVVVRGQGGNFCAGGDIAQYPAFRFDAQSLRHFHEEQVWPALQAMLDCDVPILAQIEGACMGAGVEIACCCDLRVAGVDARFGAPIARLGFPMAPREAALVARVLGESCARAMLLGAQVYPAPALQATGFLCACVQGTQLEEHVQTLAQRMASLAPQAARLNKQTLRAMLSGVARGVAPDTASDPYAYASSAEHREGITAFLDKRPPCF